MVGEGGGVRALRELVTEISWSQKVWRVKAAQQKSVWLQQVWLDNVFATVELARLSAPSNGASAWPCSLHKFVARPLARKTDSPCIVTGEIYSALS